MNKLTQDILEKLYYQFFPTILGRKNRYPIRHYIETFGYVLKTGISWRDLKTPLHWSSYYKKFKIWADSGLFKILHKTMLAVAKQKNKLTNDHLKTLYIDSTLIKNVKGVDLLGKNHYDRNRKGNKLTLIISSNGLPVSISLTTANRHDLLEVIPAIENIQVKIISSRLVADRGYVSKSLQKNLKSKKIRLIYPYKKNQRVKNTKLEKSLNKRYLVENTFATLQNYRKLRLRYEKLFTTFVQFYYFGLSELLAQKISN